MYEKNDKYLQKKSLWQSDIELQIVHNVWLKYHLEY